MVKPGRLGASIRSIIPHLPVTHFVCVCVRVSGVMCMCVLPFDVCGEKCQF